MLNLAELASITSSLPIIIDDQAVDSTNNAASTKRKTCYHKECCLDKHLVNTHSVCREGFSFIPTLWLNSKVVIGGFIHQTRNSTIGGKQRKDLRRLWATEGEISSIINNFRIAEDAFSKAFKQAAAESVSFLHDIRSSLSLVMSSCESLINETRGSNFSDKLKSSDPSLFRLYQAISLLTEQLELADIISNPDSITYGKKSQSDIYQFFYKISKLFHPRAKVRGINIRLEGSLYEKVELYKSFQLIPLVLLDNAVKYADPGSEITIAYISRADGLYIEFRSLGPTVPPDMTESIFKRGVRGRNIAEKCTGSGLGLHIASEVIRAHGFHLSYEARQQIVPGLGLNCFVLFIDSKFLIS